MWWTWHLLSFYWGHKPLRPLHSKHSFGNLAQDSSQGLPAEVKNGVCLSQKIQIIRFIVEPEILTLPLPKANGCRPKGTEGDTYFVTQLRALCQHKGAKLDWGTFLKTKLYPS